MHKKLIEAAEEQSQTWIHIKPQMIQIQGLYGRTLEWERQINTLNQSLRSMSSIYKETLKSFERSVHQLKNYYGHEAMEANINPLYAYMNELTKSHQAFVLLLENTFIPQLTSFQVIKQLKQFQLALTSEQTFITMLRSKMLKSLEQHAELKAHFHEHVHADQIDPWLRERLLFREIRGLVKKENEYQDKIKRTKQNMARFEAELTQKFTLFYRELFSASILNQSTSVPVSYSSSLLSSNIHSTQTHWDAIEKLKETTSFEQIWVAKKLDLDEIWNSQQTLASCSLIENPLKIVKEGLLSRPAKYRKSNWRLSLFVLTETGYLHCFKCQPKASKRHYTLIKSSSSSDNLKSVNQILNDLPIYDDLNKPETFFSISLNQPKVQLQFLQDPSHLHVIQLIVPRKPTLFNGSKTTSYLIKCNSENEMIEWAAPLKSKIESYLPEGPPKPLFKTPGRIESEVEEFMIMKEASSTTLCPPSSEVSKKENCKGNQIDTIVVVSNDYEGNNELEKRYDLSMKSNASIGSFSGDRTLIVS